MYISRICFYVREIELLGLLWDIISVQDIFRKDWAK